MKKSIVSVMSVLTGTVFGAGVAGKVYFEKNHKIRELSDKHLALFLMMNQWVKVKQENKNLAEYFEKNNFKRIAVYGMSFAGEALINELRDTDILVAYGIDKNAEQLYSDVKIVSVDDLLEEVDAVVVTAITFFDEIEDKLSKKMECPIISLEDILYEV